MPRLPQMLSHRFSPRPNVQLLIYLPDMRMHRVETDLHRLGNFLVHITLHKIPEHLLLASRKLLLVGGRLRLAVK